MGRSDQRGNEMINSVYFNSIEIGTVQTVEAFGNITFRAIYKKSKMELFFQSISTI